MPKQGSGIDRAGRVVLEKGMSKLATISRLIARSFTKFDVFF